MLCVGKFKDGGKDESLLELLKSSITRTGLVEGELGVKNLGERTKELAMQAIMPRKVHTLPASFEGGILRWFTLCLGVDPGSVNGVPEEEEFRLKEIALGRFCDQLVPLQSVEGLGERLPCSSWVLVRRWWCENKLPRISQQIL